VSESLAGRLASGEPLVGTFLTLPGATAAELISEPFDLVVIDLEHAALGPLEAQEMILGAQAAGAYALVRLPADAYPLMTQVLDAGADGLLLADVSSADQASAVVQRTLHPPVGTRGWGPRRLNLRGRTSGSTLKEQSVWVQLESSTGIEQARSIVTVPGITAAIVGTADLSFSLGQPLNMASVSLRAAVITARQACEAAGVTFGVAGALDSAPRELLKGASILLHSTDARLCAGAADSAADWMRSASNTNNSEPTE
jgi:2-keto-3-deoxy-L-rhamnonate aldolase RhmA